MLAPENNESWCQTHFMSYKENPETVSDEQQPQSGGEGVTIDHQKKTFVLQQRFMRGNLTFTNTMERS